MTKVQMPFGGIKASGYAFVLVILLPIRFIGIGGLNETEGGRMMMALSAPLLVLPLLAGRLARHYAPATICGAGLLLSAIGLLWLSYVPVESGPVAALAPILSTHMPLDLRHTSALVGKLRRRLRD
ncbi:hypothetical protein [Asticcacaulis sp.]|uniref:hypothetical protein n=1 Tax=Asticcacaulis sp. TaxID=1872648 RepID=UPI002BEA42DE|nr:hypothetical protein [Asticcacaulis sp.]HTM82783.1 hypothetical protein [Asticcacaulis sp.]